jgi:hypothetical protein
VISKEKNLSIVLFQPYDNLFSTALEGQETWMTIPI